MTARKTTNVDAVLPSALDTGLAVSRDPVKAAREQVRDEETCPGSRVDGVFEEDLRKQLRVAVRFAKAGFDGRVGEEVE